jgi:hypothetical protein
VTHVRKGARAKRIRQAAVAARREAWLAQVAADAALIVQFETEYPEAAK